MGGAEGHEVLELSLINSLDDIPRLAAWVEGLGNRFGISTQAVQRINLVLEELIANTIAYGYPDGGEHTISVRLTMKPAVIELEISDDAMPFDPLAEHPGPYLGADLDQRRVGGLGLYLVGRLVSEGHYTRQDGINRLKLTLETGLQAPDQSRR